MEMLPRGTNFTIVTDHNPLVHLPTQPNLSRRQVRWVQYLSRFTFNWVYKPGATNKVADALSRYPPKISTLAVMLLALRTRSQSKSQAHTNAVAPPQSQTENQILPESPGAQKGGRNQVILLHKHLCKAQPILGNLTEPWTYMKL